MEEAPEKIKNFIEKIIDADLKANKNNGKVVTRFPPEPNGYLHIGHAQAIWLNFTLAQEYSGVCHLRFDDTNPLVEDSEFIDSMKKDVQWLGFDWGSNLFFASDYFNFLYEQSLHLIQSGKAYVCGLSKEEVKEYRGTLTEPGRNSPMRSQSVEQNLLLFEEMKAGKFEEGEYVLRAKIDMKSPNMNMRDPVIYRIRKVSHHRVGDQWCIYPTYDFTHSLSDAVEGVTHSICTLEFEDHRPLYDWVVEHSTLEARPQQIEFARLNLDYTVTSKRRLSKLIEAGNVSGWDDPRMPTIKGLRRRGVPPKAIRNFCHAAGVTKKNSVISLGVFESCIREELDDEADRAMVVLKPLKVVIENYPENQQEKLDGPLHPKKSERGRRNFSFAREIYIEQGDFMEDPPKKFFRLAVNKEVRLRNAYVIHCHEVIKDESTGEVTELRCTYLPETLHGKPAAHGKKIKGIIHWVSCEDSQKVEVRLFDRLFKVHNPLELSNEEEYEASVNPASLEVVTEARTELGLKSAKMGKKYQFERLGYFCLDSKDSKEEALVFNRIITLKDSWAKQTK